MKTLDVLIKARKIVHTGWFQGNYSNRGQTRYCILGAVCKASGLPEGEVFPENPLASRALEYIRGVVGYYVSEFNDDPFRTNTEVLAAMDQAIKNAKRRHKNGKRYANAANTF